jgi:hypothetical protein
MTRRERNREQQTGWGLPVLGLVGVFLGGAAGWVITMPDWERAALLSQAGRQVEKLADAVTGSPRPYRHFDDCRAAHAAGYFNIKRSEPSYRADMDGDKDGLACEPYPGSEPPTRWPW